MEKKVIDAPYQEKLTDTQMMARLQQKKNMLRQLLNEKGVMQKDKSNKFDNYNYFSEAGYKKLFTELFSKVGLELSSDVENVERYTVEGKQSNGRFVRMRFILSDIDTGYSETSTVCGEGFDKGDKALYKAYTGALKYYLADTFMVATGDDPEKESPEGKEDIVYVNEEVTTKQYRRFIDNYFATKPQLELAFLEKYKIKRLDQLDSKLTLKQIDDLITKLKADLDRDGMNSRKDTF